MANSDKNNETQFYSYNLYVAPLLKGTKPVRNIIFYSDKTKDDFEKSTMVTDLKNGGKYIFTRFPVVTGEEHIFEPMSVRLDTKLRELGYGEVLTNFDLDYILYNDFDKLLDDRLIKDRLGDPDVNTFYENAKYADSNEKINIKNNI